MKKSCYVSILSAAILAFGFCRPMQASTIVEIDENGNGSINFGSGPTFITGTLQQDPGPGGQPDALTYALGAPNLTEGDLFLTEGGQIEDIIRFNPTGAGGDSAYLSSVLFYASDVNGIEDLADSSQPPSAFYANTLTLPETAIGNQTDYTPISGQPGFVSGFNVTYMMTSPVPEPSSIFLLVSGAGIFFAGRRIRQACRRD